MPEGAIRPAGPAVSPLAQTGQGRRQADSLNFAGILIAVYLIATRIGSKPVSTIGIEVGGIPVYFTELFLVVLTITVIFSSWDKFIIWALTANGARLGGAMVWVLVVLSAVYAYLAYPVWKIFAIRDLAIFGYASVFALAFFSLKTKAQARQLLRILIYAGAATGAALVIETLAGTNILVSTVEIRVVAETGEAIESRGGGDVGGVVGVSLAGLIVYLVTKRERFGLHALLAVVCLAGLVIGQTRSASYALFVSIATCALFIDWKSYQRIALWAAGLCMTAGLFVLLLEGTQLSGAVTGFVKAMSSGTALAEDGNFRFRLLRWTYVYNEWLGSPLFGLGFGAPLVPPNFITRWESGLNAGLPHNTYLTVLARMGLAGFTPIVLAWSGALVRAFRHRLLGVIDADLAASATMLVMLATFAGSVLFFERPWNCVPFWILLAIAYRLSDGSGKRLSSPQSQSAAIKQPALR
jgi:O-antigen ligase